MSNAEYEYEETPPPHHSPGGTHWEGCLSDWNLQSLIPLFESSKIDDDIFYELTDEQIAELLPPKSYALGTRLKLSKNLKILKDTQKSKDVSMVTITSSTSSISSSTFIADKISLKKNLSSASGVKIEIEELDLEEFLKKHHDGKCLLQLYDIKKTFSDDERSLLVEILAKFILFNTTKPTKADYLTIQTKILELFTSEDRVYYIPPKEEGEHQRLARGKLFDKVRNLKEWMRAKGLLSRKKESLTTVDEPLEDTVPGNDEKNALEWLKYNREPWVDVEKQWSVTSSYRLAELKRTHELQEYLDKYKVLTQSLGYMLIESDFNKIYPEKELALFASWSSFKEKICIILKNTKKDLLLITLCKALEDAASEETIDAIVVQSLPSLIIPNRKVKLGKIFKKPSIKESRDSFILYVETATDLEPAIEARRKLMSAYGKGATIQPYIVVVGESRTNISSAYVCINNIVYKLNGVLKAVDVCFKSFYALDLEYPAESEQVWLTIQKLLYDITLPNKDKKIFNVTTFINKLNRINS